MREVAVIRDDEKPCSILIEPPYREKPRVNVFEIIRDLLTVVSILDRRNDALGLIEKKVIDLLFFRDGLAVYLDVTYSGVHSQPFFPDHGSVHGHSPSLYEISGMPPAGYSGVR